MTAAISNTLTARAARIVAAVVQALMRTRGLMKMTRCYQITTTLFRMSKRKGVSSDSISSLVIMTLHAEYVLNAAAGEQGGDLERTNPVIGLTLIYSTS